MGCAAWWNTKEGRKVDMFSVYPALKNASQDFRLSIYGENETVIGCSFTATKEHEVDAAITALIAVRMLLRSNVKPLPRSKSVAARPAAPDGKGDAG
jgi:hypothetical protein